MLGEVDRVAVVGLRRFGLRLVEVLEREVVLVRRVHLGAELVRFFELGRRRVHVDRVDGVAAAAEAERSTPDASRRQRRRRNDAERLRR